MSGRDLLGAQALLGGKLDVDAHPVSQKAQLGQQLPAGAGDGLGVDIAEKMIFPTEDAQGLQHELAGVVRVLHHGGGEEEPLDIVPPVKLDGQVGQLPGGEGGPAGVVGHPVDAIGAVIGTGVALQHLQESDAPAVGGKAVAAAAGHGGPQSAGPGRAVQTGGGAGRVVFGGVGQDGELVQQVHGDPSLTRK